ncbi:glycosyltransferase [Solibacillus sp. NPDC093137]|uniref:glycosyltransferase n=1 Tax=Solibacillus sp. NPDC093137 TaxID=3390678 RepID=UPI003CFD6CB3
MKVLHIIPTLASGGAEKMLVDIVKESIKFGVKCEVAVLTPNSNFFGEELEKLNVSIYYGNTEKVYTYKNILFLRKIFKLNKYDIIHTHLFSAQLFAPMALINIKKNAKLFTTEHSTHNKRRNKKIFFILDYLMYAQYDKIIAITNDTKIKLNNYLRNTTKKTVVIENGIDLLVYRNALPIKREIINPKIKNGEKIVLMVAGMREQKDHKTLIRASKILPPEYRVIFVGDGEKMEEIQGYALEYGDPSILFLGNRKDVASIMKASDIFVLSSKWEGFGLVIVEATASGLPIIASDVPGLNEVVKKMNGVLFRPSNEVDLAKKIITVNKKPVMPIEIEEFGIENTVEKYFLLYKETIFKG